MMTIEQAQGMSRTLWKSGTEAEERLRAKCRWEHMTRLAVLVEWGDPREWEPIAEGE